MLLSLGYVAYNFICGGQVQQHFQFPYFRTAPAGWKVSLS